MADFLTRQWKQVVISALTEKPFIVELNISIAVKLSGIPGGVQYTSPFSFVFGL